MISPPKLEHELHISRADFGQALKIAAQVRTKFPGPVGLHFDTDCLTIENGGTATTVPARGTWPVPIFVGPYWVRRMCKRLPAGDPIHLRVEMERLFVNRYSEACSLTAAGLVGIDEASRANEARLIQEAARILQPLRVVPEDLEKLVAEIRENGYLTPLMEERKLISMIAKAWVLLAPLGVETDDLRQLVDNAVRNAWK